MKNARDSLLDELAALVGDRHVIGSDGDQEPYVVDWRGRYHGRARAVVKAATYYNDPAKLLEASEDLGEAMPGLDVSKLPQEELMQTRGW